MCGGQASLDNALPRVHRRCYLEERPGCSSRKTLRFSLMGRRYLSTRLSLLCSVLLVLSLPKARKTMKAKAAAVIRVTVTVTATARRVRALLLPAARKNRSLMKQSTCAS